MSQQTLRLGFGALSPALSKQLSDQGFGFNEDEVEHFQKDLGAIIRLKVRGIIPLGEIKKAETRLFKKITAHVESVIK